MIEQWAFTKTRIADDKSNSSLREQTLYELLSAPHFLAAELEISVSIDCVLALQVGPFRSWELDRLRWFGGDYRLICVDPEVR